MHIVRLSLTNFRCYRSLDFQPPSGVSVLVGGNAQGKSSLLESVFVAATSKSLGASDRELVRWDAGLDDGLHYAQVGVELARGDERHRVDVVYPLELESDGQASPDRRITKRVRVDGVARRGIDALGLLQVALFRPQDLALVDGPPAERRRYLDIVLCQLDRAYCRALAEYNRVLTQRNSLLKQLQAARSAADELAFWDDRLVTAGARVLASRLAATARLDDHARAIHSELVPGSNLRLDYASTIPVGDADIPDAPLGHASPGTNGATPSSVMAASESRLAAAFATALADSRPEERARGATVIGPHRDDLTFTLDGMALRTFGSRGQQRTAALAVKLAEARYLEASAGESPVLLLDDVFSELDASRREYLLAHLRGERQLFLTTTDLGQLPDPFVRQAAVFQVEAGALATATPQP